MAEYGERSVEMVGKYNNAFTIMLEFYGTEKAISAISKRDASDLQKVLLALPKRRKDRVETRDLTLLEAIEVKGLDKLHPDTINWYINAYGNLWDWAKRHGYVDTALFHDLKVKKATNEESPREPFSETQTKTIYRELTENTSGLVKSDDYKWATLIGLFTGARVNEVGQLKVSDIRNDNGTWYFDINADGSDKKVKTKAGQRRIPIHEELIKLGFLDFVKAKPQDQRLFLSFSNGGKNGGAVRLT